MKLDVGDPCSNPAECHVHGGESIQHQDEPDEGTLPDESSVLHDYDVHDKNRLVGASLMLSHKDKLTESVSC